MFIHLYERTSFSYRDAYRDLDSEVYVGEVKLLGGRTVREARDFDDGGVRRHRVVAPLHSCGPRPDPRNQHLLFSLGVPP